MSWVGGTEDGGRCEMAGRGVAGEDVVDAVEGEGRGREDRRVRLVRESCDDRRVSDDVEDVGEYGVRFDDCRLIVVVETGDCAVGAGCGGLWVGWWGSREERFVEGEVDGGRVGGERVESGAV